MRRKPQQQSERQRETRKGDLLMAGINREMDREIRHCTAMENVVLKKFDVGSGATEKLASPCFAAGRETGIGSLLECSM